MDPFTLGLAMASTALSTYGKLSSAGAQSRNDFAAGENEMQRAELYGLNAETAKANVGLLTTQADIAGLGENFAYAKARLQKGRISEQGRVTMAAQRSEFASRNVDPTFGSPLLKQAITAGRIAQDLDLTDAGAAMEAADAKTRKAGILGQAAGAQGQVVTALGEKLSSQNRAKSLFSKSQDDVTAGAIGAVSSLLSGATSISGGFGGSGGTATTISYSGQSWPAFG